MTPFALAEHLLAMAGCQGGSCAVTSVGVPSYRSIHDLQGDHVLEAAVADLFEDGLIQRHVRKMRRVYRARLEALAPRSGATSVIS
jgi:hypothetical protein